MVDVSEDAHDRGTRLKKLWVVVVRLFNLWPEEPLFHFARHGDGSLIRNHDGLRLACYALLDGLVHRCENTHLH